VVPGWYAQESGIAASGDMFRWFVNGQPQSGADNPFRCLARLAEQRGINEGLIALDWFSGNKTPYVNGSLTGVISGLTLATRPEDIYRALLEATGFGTRRIIEEFEQGEKITAVVCCGGIAAKDPFLMGIYADICLRDVRVPAPDDTAALGSAVYAASAAGKTLRVPAEPRAVYRPREDNAAVYDRMYARYLALGEAVRQAGAR
jgi:L-ribulokinase